MVRRTNFKDSDIINIIILYNSPKYWTHSPTFFCGAATGIKVGENLHDIRQIFQTFFVFWVPSVLLRLSQTNKAIYRNLKNILKNMPGSNFKIGHLFNQNSTIVSQRLYMTNSSCFTADKNFG